MCFPYQPSFRNQEGLKASDPLGFVSFGCFAAQWKKTGGGQAYCFRHSMMKWSPGEQPKVVIHKYSIYNKMAQQRFSTKKYVGSRVRPIFPCYSKTKEKFFLEPTHPKQISFCLKSHVLQTPPKSKFNTKNKQFFGRNLNSRIFCWSFRVPFCSFDPRPRCNASHQRLVLWLIRVGDTMFLGANLAPGNKLKLISKAFFCCLAWWHFSCQNSGICHLRFPELSCF